jgi:hypothetical protein
MTLYHLHSDDLRDGGVECQSVTARLLGGARAAISVIRRTIIGAKMRQRQSEPMFHAAKETEQSPPEDLLRYPQRPLILGDKWDF